MLLQNIIEFLHTQELHSNTPAQTQKLNDSVRRLPGS